MTPDDAAAAVESARQQAQASAAQDLDRLRHQALQAGPKRAELLFPAGRGSSAQVEVNARGSRMLRNWYVQVCSAALSEGLGARVAVPAAAEIDATATALKGALGSRDPDLPLRLAGSLHRDATLYAAQTAHRARSTLTEVAPSRATAHLARQAPLDQTRTAILGQWYQRCYYAAVDSQLGLLQPLQAVTVAEVRQVTISVETGQPRRIIGADGIPLVTAYGTAMTDIDRRLAAGHTQIVDSPTVQVENTLLRTRAAHAWDSAVGAQAWENRDNRRRNWATAAGIPTATADQPWDRIAGDHQSRLIAVWLDTHRTNEPQLSFAQPPTDPTFQAKLIVGPPRDAAAAMFNHHRPPTAATQGRQVAAAMFPYPLSEPARACTTPETANTTRPLSARRPVERDAQR